MSKTFAESSAEHENRIENEPVNVGEPPIHARMDVGETERYSICEDAKINDPEHELYLVADGASGTKGKNGSGERASRIVSACVQEDLGRALDLKLNNIATSQAENPERSAQLLKKEVEAAMRGTLGRADQQILEKRKSHPDFAECATTVTLTKVIEIPGGEQILCLLNIGDSRAYLQRGGEIHRLTVDDSFASDSLRRELGLDDTSNMTPQEIQKKEGELRQKLRLLERASSADQLSGTLRFLYPYRNKISRSLGDEASFANAKFQTIKLKKGDRLLLTSDGMNQLSQERMQELLNVPGDDRETERLLQTEADQLGADEHSPRAKADEISAVVRTFDGKPIRSKKEEPSEYHPTQVDVVTWTKQRETVDAKMVMLLHEVHSERDARKKIDLELKMTELEIQQATLDYWLAKAEPEARLTTGKKAEIMQSAQQRIEDVKEKQEGLRVKIQNLDQDAALHRAKRVA